MSTPHDVFISYSSYNKAYADAICNYLENEGIRCWYAPRDITPGKNWSGEIFLGISSAKILVLVLSPEANASDQVLREVNLAVTHKLHIVTFIVEQTATSADLQYYISTVHWIDALTRPMEEHLYSLVRAAQGLLGLQAKSAPHAEAVAEEVSAPVPPAEEVSPPVQAPPQKEKAPPVPAVAKAAEEAPPKTKPVQENAPPKTQSGPLTLENYDSAMFTIKGTVLTKAKKGIKGHIEIPQGVTAIEGAFKDKVSLTGITLPDTVTSIGKSAFSQCKNLTEITIPNRVASIGESAFEGCESLKAITLPSSVISVGYTSFYGCKNLESVRLSDKLKSIEQFAFSQCKKLTAIHIPASVTRIKKNPFTDCDNLREISVDKESPFAVADGLLIEKASGTLLWCSAGRVGHVSIPSGVTCIGMRAFWRCEKLAEITLPSGVTSIEEGAFMNCYHLRNISLSSGLTSIGSHAFEHCKSLESILIPSSVQLIKSSAFFMCENLKIAVLQNSATVLEDGAFGSDCEIRYENTPGGTLQQEVYKPDNGYF